MALLTTTTTKSLDTSASWKVGEDSRSHLFGPSGSARTVYGSSSSDRPPTNQNPISRSSPLLVANTDVKSEPLRTNQQRPPPPPPLLTTTTEPSSVPPPTPTSPVCKRQRILQEIIATERTYVAGLQLVDRAFYAPLLQAAKHPSTLILTPKRISDIFSNFSDILNVNREFLLQLEGRFGLSPPPPDSTAPPTMPADATGIRIGDIFLSVAPFFKMYSVYIRNFHRAVTLLRTTVDTHPPFRQFVRQVNARSDLKNLTIDSYLMLPIQRLPRYRLLLTDLARHTPGDHSDLPLVTKALGVIQEVAQFVNEMIRQHEMYTTMVSIQKALTGYNDSLIVPGRKFIKRGPVRKICRKNHQPREFFLFTDILIYASPALLENNYNFHRKFPLEECRVIDVPDTPQAPLKNVFQIYSRENREKSFGVYTETPRLKQEWVGALHRAITEHINARKTLRVDRSSRGRRAQSMFINIPSTTTPGSPLALSNLSMAATHWDDDKSSTPGTPADPHPATATAADDDDDDDEFGPDRGGPSHSYSNADLNSDHLPPPLSLSPVAQASPTSPRVVQNYNAPVWIPDEQAVRCLICYEEFSLFRRKHHCRACGHIVCHYCSTKTIVIPGSWESEDKEARACDQCVALLFGKEHLSDTKQRQNNPRGLRGPASYLGRTRAGRSSSSATATHSLFGLVAHPAGASTPDLFASPPIMVASKRQSFTDILPDPIDRRRWSSSATPGTPNQRFSIGATPTTHTTTTSASSSTLSSPTSPKRLIDYGLSTARRMSFVSWTYSLPRLALSSVSLASSHDESVFSLEPLKSNDDPPKAAADPEPSTPDPTPTPSKSALSPPALSLKPPSPRPPPTNISPRPATLLISPNQSPTLASPPLSLANLTISTTFNATTTKPTSVRRFSIARAKSPPPTLQLSPGKTHRLSEFRIKAAASTVVDDTHSPFLVSERPPSRPGLSMVESEVYKGSDSISAADLPISRRSTAPIAFAEDNRMGMPLCSDPALSFTSSNRMSIISNSSSCSSGGSSILNSSGSSLATSSLLRDHIKYHSARKTDQGRSASWQCCLCLQDFTVFRWRNTCSRCQRAVCSDCLTKRSSQQLLQSGLDGASPVRSATRKAPLPYRPTPVRADSAMDVSTTTADPNSPSPMPKRLPSCQQGDGLVSSTAANPTLTLAHYPDQNPEGQAVLASSLHQPQPQLGSPPDTPLTHRSVGIVAGGPVRPCPPPRPSCMPRRNPRPFATSKGLSDSLMLTTVAETANSPAAPIKNVSPTSPASCSTPHLPLTTNRFSCPPNSVAFPLVSASASLPGRRNITICHERPSLIAPHPSLTGSGPGTPMNNGKLCDVCARGLDPAHVVVNEDGSGWFYRIPG
ncbi:hypothetical protein H4R33_004999 [Dimargaris cristalligena]|nr:hypothetical protein H4R33_004999 [Dimargaris cristalligena]